VPILIVVKISMIILPLKFASGAIWIGCLVALTIYAGKRKFRGALSVANKRFPILYILIGNQAVVCYNSFESSITERKPIADGVII